MARIIANPFRNTIIGTPLPSTEAMAATRLLALCPAHAETPLILSPELAARAGVASVAIKDERARMGLGSFKALGAAYAIAREAEAALASGTGGDLTGGDLAQALAGRTYVTASAGNHGLSVAAGARVFGAEAVIYLSATVPEAFAARLRAMGASVVRAGADYEASMEAAAGDATAKGWTLLSDSTWPDYTRLPLLVMEGYVQLAREAAAQLEAPPTHILLQAGVGGLAAAVAAHARQVWGDGPQIIVVEPEAAPALQASIQAGHVVDTQGPVSVMGRLDCKTASMVAFHGLARDADHFMTLSEEEVLRALPILAQLGLETTASGGAGLAALLSGMALGAEARVWAVLSEGPEDG